MYIILKSRAEMLCFFSDAGILKNEKEIEIFMLDSSCGIIINSTKEQTNPIKRRISI